MTEAELQAIEAQLASLGGRDEWDGRDDYLVPECTALLSEVKRLREWIDTTGRGSTTSREVDELLGIPHPWETPA